MNLTTLRRVMLPIGVVVALIATASLNPVVAQRNEFPGRRLGGGSRGDCAIDTPALAALNPANNLGVTARSQPVLYFAMPKVDQRYGVDFLLQDTKGATVYETTLSTGTGEAVVGVPIPAGTLAVDQDYQWYFAIACHPDDPAQMVVLSGWLRRVNTSLDTPVDTPTAMTVERKLEQVGAEKAAGLWSDAIATLVELRQTHPDHPAVHQQWTQLLQTLSLESLASQFFASQFEVKLLQ
ncbi:DUF928 domain-containing protein [Trichothermofontia sp.]